MEKCIINWLEQPESHFVVQLGWLIPFSIYVRVKLKSDSLSNIFLKIALELMIILFMIVIYKFTYILSLHSLIIILSVVVAYWWLNDFETYFNLKKLKKISVRKKFKRRRFNL